MKKTKFLLILILLANIICAQDDEGAVFFEKGIALYELVYDDLQLDDEIENLDTSKIEDKIKFELLIEQKEVLLEKSFENFKILIEKYPESSLIYRAMNNASLVSSELEKYDEAIIYCKKVLKSKAKDDEKGGIGKGIMADPYALYKNRACKNLAEIYIKKEDFKEALKYIKLITKYPYQHFCGNAYATDEIYIATLKTKSYNGLGKFQKALSYSLPHIFNNGLASNSEIVELTVKILKENYNMDNVVLDFEMAGLNYFKETVKRNKNEWEECYIDFLDQKIMLPFYSLEYTDDKNKAVKEGIEESYFYELLKRE